MCADSAGRRETILHIRVYCEQVQAVTLLIQYASHHPSKQGLCLYHARA